MMTEDEILKLGFTEINEIKTLKNETITDGILFESLAKNR